MWLRNLIGAGLLPAGEVDGRCVADVQPADLRGYQHVHFFAGIGGWAYAAQLAAWPEERELWSASCPCQPWSLAGRRGGAHDPRDLWRHVVRLLRAVRPAYIVGEQVAAAPGYDWFDRASADLVGENYSCRAVDIPALAVNAPHCRQRLYWVAVAQSVRARLERPWADRAALCDPSDQSADAIAGGGVGRRHTDTRSALPWSGAMLRAGADRHWRGGEPGLCRMVDGLPGGLVELRAREATDTAPPARVKRAALWRGYGNAVVPQLAAQVLLALLEMDET